MGDAFNPQLESLILEDPNDPAPYLVYADWLLGQGDPRGELIAVQHALRHQHRSRHIAYDRLVDPPSGRSAPPLSNSAELEALERALFVRHGAEWLGPLSRENSHVRLRWRLGFVAEASFRMAAGVFDQERNLILELLQRPVARLLRSLRVDLSLSPFQIEFCRFRWLDHQRSIERLNIISGGYFTPRTKPQLEVAQLAHTFPRLRSLRLIPRHAMNLRGIDFPGLRSLEIIDISSPDPWTGIGDAVLPELSSLSLEGSGAGNTNLAPHLAPMFRTDGKTQLKRLRLAQFIDGNTLLELLAEWPVIRRLELLDLSGCLVTDRGVDAVLRNADRFHHLRELVIPRERLSPDRERALEALGPKIRSASFPRRRRHHQVAAT